MAILRVLVVEDQDVKFADVRKRLVAAFRKEGLTKPVIERQSNYTDAVMHLAKNRCDLLILDLKIPVAAGGMPTFEASTNVLRYIASTPGTRPFRTIALTSYPDADMAPLLAMDPTLTLEAYSADNVSWLNRIVVEMRYLLSAKSSLMRFFSEDFDLDLLMVVARYKNEFEPVRAAVDWVGQPTSDSRLGARQNAFGRLRLRPGKVMTAGLVCVQETGLSVSAALVGYLVSLYRPKRLVMLGMCCGLNDERSPAKSKLGDVVIADETACWDEGKYSEELVASDPFYVRPVTRVPEGNFRSALRGLVETKETELQKALLQASSAFDLNEIEAKCGEPISREPKVHLGLLLSGSSVVDSVSQIATIRQRFPAAIGLEMEAHSIYCAVDTAVGAKPIGLVVKGVADHGQGKKNKEAQKWASTMSYVAAAKILALLD